MRQLFFFPTMVKNWLVAFHHVLILRFPILKHKTCKLLHGLFHSKVRCSLLFEATLLPAGSASNSRLFCCHGSHGSKHTCKENNKTSKKAVGLGWQNNHFACASCLFSCHRCTNTIQNCLNSSFQEDAKDMNTTQPFFDSFFFKLRYSPPTVDKLKDHGLITMNFQTAWDHFLRDVFAVVNLRNRTRKERRQTFCDINNCVWKKSCQTLPSFKQML